MKEFWKYFSENIKQVIADLKSKDKEKRRKQIPNVLTLTRGILAPFTIIPTVITGHIYVAFILIAICSLTDSFDGWYARNYNAQSEFGALLDAICDKLFVVTLAFPLVFKYTEWIVIILILELIIAIINGCSQLKGFVPKSSITGKIKTVVLDSSVALCYMDLLPIVTIPKAVLWVTSIFTNVMQALSIFGYHRTYRENINQKKLETAL